MSGDHAALDDHEDAEAAASSDDLFPAVPIPDDDCPDEKDGDASFEWKEDESGEVDGATSTVPPDEDPLAYASVVEAHSEVVSYAILCDVRLSIPMNLVDATSHDV